METNLLENLWNRTLKQTSETTTWTQEVAFLYKNGISMEETLQFLFHNKPSLVDFEKWIEKHKKEIFDQNEAIENVFSEEELNFWNENGFIVLKNAIPKEDCIQTQNAIWEFLNMNVDETESWYIQHPEQRGLMVNFSNHPTLNKNRDSIKIQKAFEQLYNSKKIYKTIDKVSFNPPITSNYSFLGSPLHWDVSLKLPIPFRLQGLIYLSDCNENEGCFQCVPGFHNKIENWMNGLSSKDNPREVALKTLQPISITGKAGDLVIWNQALPHCASPNKGILPRMVQYLTYFPEDYKEQEVWI